MAALTAELGRFVSALRLADVPPQAQAVAKSGFTDCFGVMVAGAREDLVRLIDRELASADGAELASLLPSRERRNVEDAALVNGVAAHVLDYDDVTLDGHTSAVLVPASSLPGFFPGFEAGSTRVHVKHGIVSAAIAIVLFAFAWYAARSRP